jgi:hypothetical protein
MPGNVAGIQFASENNPMEKLFGLGAVDHQNRLVSISVKVVPDGA